MNKIPIGIFILACLLLLFPSCYNDNEYDLYPYPGTKCDSSNVTYSQTIAPILSANCNICHSTAVASGGVVTDNYNGLIIIANSGRLWIDVNWESGADPMPKGGSKLSACDLGKIKKWINLGTPNN
jgi:hypothetical protein